MRSSREILARNDADATDIAVDDRKPGDELEVMFDLLQALIHRRRPDRRRHHLPEHRRGCDLHQNPPKKSIKISRSHQNQEEKKFKPYLMVRHGLGFKVCFEIGVGEDREVSLPFAGDDSLWILIDLEA